MIFTADAEELAEHAAEADRLAREIMAGVDVATPGFEETLAAILYTALTVEASAELQGIILQFPACEEIGAFAQASRLISWETLLPMLNADVTPKQAKALAERLRGMAAICEAWAG